MALFRSFSACCFLFPGLLFLSACMPTGFSQGAQSEDVLGTICTINLYEYGRNGLYSEVFNRLRELEDIFSANRDGTDLDRINRNAGFAPVKVRAELIEVLDIALVIAEKSFGAFDPSIGPLVKLWGIGSDRARVPDDHERENALKLIDYRDIEIDRDAGTVFLKRENMALDLGAIAKGYAADKIVKLLTQKGVKRAIIDLGGDIFALGERKTGMSLSGFLGSLLSGEKGAERDDSFWRIGIQNPGDSRGSYLGILRVKNKSVVTSGTYERFLEENGIFYHHILSVENGYPADNGIVSVTVSADTCVIADALSTAAFALGYERGMELIESVPGAEGIFVFEDYGITMTDGIKTRFTLNAGEYFIRYAKPAGSRKSGITARLRSLPFRT